MSLKRAREKAILCKGPPAVKQRYLLYGRHTLLSSLSLLSIFCSQPVFYAFNFIYIRFFGLFWRNNFFFYIWILISTDDGECARLLRRLRARHFNRLDRNFANCCIGRQRERERTKRTTKDNIGSSTEFIRWIALADHFASRAHTLHLELALLSAPSRLLSVASVEAFFNKAIRSRTFNGLALPLTRYISMRGLEP